MATKTEIYEFRKKEENDFYNVEDFNNNMDMMETALTEFDDSGTAEGVTSFPDMLAKLVTGNKLAVTLKNLKAGLQFVLHAGSIVNNCVTDNPNLPLSAAQGKTLQDMITVLNNEQQKLSSNLDNRIGVGEKFTSGTLLNIIKQMSDGIHMALLSETVSDIPFSDIENYIIVFKGTSYGDSYTRIMAFPMSQSSAPKWGMVFWDSSRIVWV